MIQTQIHYFKGGNTQIHSMSAWSALIFIFFIQLLSILTMVLSVWFQIYLYWWMDCNEILHMIPRGWNIMTLVKMLCYHNWWVWWHLVVCLQIATNWTLHFSPTPLIIRVLNLAAFLLQVIEVRSVLVHFLISTKLASMYKEECKYMIIMLKNEFARLSKIDSFCIRSWTNHPSYMEYLHMVSWNVYSLLSFLCFLSE